VTLPPVSNDREALAGFPLFPASGWQFVIAEMLGR